MAKRSTSVDNVLELMNGILFKRIVSGMRIDGSSNKEDSSTTSEKMAEGSNVLGDSPEWISVRVWLQLIQTFLTLAPIWSSTNEVARDNLGDLVYIIEHAFEISGNDITDAMEKRDAELLEAVRQKMLRKIEILKPRIREAYESLSKHASQVSATDQYLPITDSEVWGQFCSSLSVASHFLSTPMLLQIEGIVSSLQAFGEVYVTRASDCKLFRSLGLYLECVAISLARLLFLWWADETDDHDKTVMLKNASWGGIIMPYLISGVRNGQTVPNMSQGLNISGLPPGMSQLQPGILNYLEGNLSGLRQGQADRVEKTTNFSRLLRQKMQLQAQQPSLDQHQQMQQQFMQQRFLQSQKQVKQLQPQQQKLQQQYYLQALQLQQLQWQQQLADMAEIRRSQKRTKISSLDLPSMSFNPSTQGQIIGEVPMIQPGDKHLANSSTNGQITREVSAYDTLKELKEQNDGLQKKIQDLEESLCKEKCAREMKEERY